MNKFLFPRYANERTFSAFLLAFRVLFGSLMLYHGLTKMLDYSYLVAGYADPIGIGSEATLMLTIFAEFFCSIFFITGCLFRIFTIPMILTMAVAFFGVHRASFELGGELAFVYMVVLIIMYASGPGQFSLDRLIDNSCKRNHQK